MRSTQTSKITLHPAAKVTKLAPRAEVGPDDGRHWEEDGERRQQLVAVARISHAQNKGEREREREREAKFWPNDKFLFAVAKIAA